MGSKTRSLIATLIVFGMTYLPVKAQGSYAPQAGMPGSDAMKADSTAFRDWAIGCEVQRGLRQINVPDSGLVTSGSAVYATGKADVPLTLSLGDGGVATLTFSAPFYDGEGPDFAVFENGFGSGVDAFLEFAFVEVSSDGIHFFRFPSISEIPAEVQKASFETTDASLVHNLAGKFIAGYGVPFDLAELPDTALLDKQSVKYVRIIDVVGSIDSLWATSDANGHIINDPFPSNFAQGGFDLDAVGIINSTIPLGIDNTIEGRDQETMQVFDLLGRPVGNGIGRPRAVIINGKIVMQEIRR